VSLERRAPRHLVLAVLLLGSGMAGRAAPQTAEVRAAPAPRIEDLVAEAIAGAPSLGARLARLRAAQAALPAAEALDDPMVEFEYRDAGFPRQTFGADPMTMTGATVRQPLLSRARRAARRGAAEAEIGLRHAEADAVACDLTAAIRDQYGRLYALDRERAVLKDSIEIADLLTTTATSRYAAGGSDQATVLRAQLERSRLGERLVDLESGRVVIVATLNRLVGRPPSQAVGEVTHLPELPALPGPRDALPARAAELSPEVSMRHAEAQAAERRVAAAQADLSPSYSVGGGVFWQGGLDRVVTVSVGVELPFRKTRKQLPLLEASRRNLEAARLEAQDAAAEATASAMRLLAEIDRANAQMARYRAALLPQSSAALDAARASYLGGRGDFAAALDEFRRWTEIRTELARLEAGRFTAWGQLDVLVNPAEHGDWSHAHTGDGSPKENDR
jgi:outer membrane protein, heavy metal efflux system